MFGLFKKDPAKQLRKDYEKKAEEARNVQRSGDVVAAAKLYEEAEALLAKAEAAEKESA